MSTNDYSKNIVYLSKEQYQELITNETLTVNGQTITYNDNDIYVTPQAEPITDVKINGASIGSNGIADIPMANETTPGVVKIKTSSSGINLNSNNQLIIDRSSDTQYKAGGNNFKVVTPYGQHQATFYGLSKVAGVDLASETVTLGTYPDASKAAIQNMLGITDLISTEESSTATAAHALNSTFMMNGKLHRATVAIAVGDAVEVGTNCEVVKADEVFVKSTDYADSQKPGIAGINNDYGIAINNNQPGHYLYIYPATPEQIKAGTHAYRPITADRQDRSVFYGLSKIAGVDLKNETVTLGTYPETSKTAIRNMLGAVSSEVIAVQDEQPTAADTKVWLPETEAQGVQVPTYDEFQALDESSIKDVQINNVSIVNNGIASIPQANDDTLGITRGSTAYGTHVLNNGVLTLEKAGTSYIKAGTSDYRPIVTSNQHEATFYGLAKAAGDDTQSISTNAVGTYTDEAKSAIQTMLGVPSDVQVNGTSVISNGVANIPACTTSTYGVVKPHTNSFTFYDGALRPRFSSVSDVKGGSDAWKPLHADLQHAIAFYGLARAAGDATQSASSNTVGTYTAEAKAAIQTMLGIDLASIASQVDIPLVETVEGTTPSITGQPNVRYVCGEVSTLSITPPASGSMDVIFESGSTAAVLTVPNTVKWPAWFDASSLETDTTYEILITDGVYGSVMTWAT